MDRLKTIGRTAAWVILVVFLTLVGQRLYQDDQTIQELKAAEVLKELALVKQWAIAHQELLNKGAVESAGKLPIPPPPVVK